MEKQYYSFFDIVICVVHSYNTDGNNLWFFPV